MATSLLRSIQRKVLHPQGPRADEAHLAAEDVPELGELVQAGAAQGAAQGREALGIGQQVPLGIAGARHGAELEHSEGLAVQAGAHLAEEDGGAEPGAHEQGDQAHEGREADERRDGEGEIQEAFAAAAVEGPHDRTSGGQAEGRAAGQRQKMGSFRKFGTLTLRPREGRVGRRWHRTDRARHRGGREGAHTRPRDGAGGAPGPPGRGEG